MQSLIKQPLVRCVSLMSFLPALESPVARRRIPGISGARGEADRLSCISRSAFAFYMLRNELQEHNFRC